MDPKAHKRFLDYRERFTYFGAGAKLTQLGAAEFAELDGELQALEAMGEGSRDDEEEARLTELRRVLLRD